MTTYTEKLVALGAGRILFEDDQALVSEPQLAALVAAEVADAERKLAEAQADTAPIIDAGKGLRVMLEQIVNAVSIDADTTVIKFKAGGKDMAEVSVGDMFRRWDAAINKPQDTSALDAAIAAAVAPDMFWNAEDKEQDGGEDLKGFALCIADDYDIPPGEHMDLKVNCAKRLPDAVVRVSRPLDPDARSVAEVLPTPAIDAAIAKQGEQS